MLRIAICDDEPYMVKELSDRLTAYMAQKVPWHVSTFFSGQALLESGGFDLIFLDIQMKGLDGMETARRLRERGERSLLVFVTVLREQVFDAFAVEACDYLVKPVEDGRFRRTMDRALKALAQRGERSLLIRRGNAWERISQSGIVYCEVQGRKVYLHRESGEVTVFNERLEDLEKRLDERFFRCHRSYLVNLDNVQGCSGGRVMLPGGKEIPVSRLREQDFLQALLYRMKEEA